MTRAAIDAWHAALSEGTGVESGEWLTAELRKRGLFFGDRPLCTVLRPRFLSRTQYQLMTERIAVLLRAFDTVLAAALARPDVLDQFRL